MLKLLQGWKMAPIPVSAITEWSNLKPINNLRTASITIPDNLCKVVADSIFEKYESAGVCVDKDYRILDTFGNFKKYLLPEMFNFNLLELLPSELSLVVTTGLKQAIREDKAVTIEKIIFKQENLPRSIDIYVKPLNNYNNPDKVCIVYFKENNIQQQPINSEIFDRTIHTGKYYSDLEKEIVKTKNKLEQAYNALDACNIHAASFNEELISGNEELQSTNEEVQSVNEELQTVNNQYQSKIKELAELNDDLNNYFKSTVNGHIYVDKNFIIRKFTPSAIKQINVKDSDIGRPITDISTNIKFSTLAEDMKSVFNSSILIEKEIETTDRRWYQMVLLPYVRLQDNKTDGIIISFNDITELKKSQRKLMKINEDHKTFIYSVSHDLKSPLSNIEGLINLLNDKIGKNNPELKEIAEVINSSVLKMKESISELSDIPRLELEASENFVENINLVEVLNEVKESIHELLINTGSEITTEWKEENINFSKKNLRSIILNLLTNAIKYKSPHRIPEIHISSEKIEKYIILNFKDNGVGILAEDLPKIFTRFERVNKIEGIEGAGVGLYLIKKIITNAGGKITIESEYNVGTTFKVWFKA